jgi:PAS domain S-box-containing protein
MIVGRDRRIRSANDTALRMMGYASEKAVVGKSCDEVCKGDSDRCPLLDRKNVLEHAEGTLLARDGKRIPILKSVLPITLGHEDVLIETFIDITDRQKAQDALRRSKEAAESIIRTKDEFLSTISHEIRTPLNGIIGMLGLLMDSDLTPEQKDYAHTVKKSSDTLLTLINDLLDFSKIEAGKMEMEVMDFDLRLTVDDVCDMMAWKIQQKGLKFTALVHHDVPSLLRGDPGRLRQVLINLVSNAVKFTDEGSVSVRVVLEKEDADSVQLYFTVSDTGIGIPSESRPRMFHVFSQADSSTTRRYGGTGLGLAISRKIVKLMEGEIGYESELGQGSTFWFKVPFLKQKGCSEKIHYGDIRGKKILIVDPNETNRIVMVHRLRNWECRFQEAQDAAQAMECLEEAARVGDPYDIAIVDMQLPDRDGVELAGRIRGDPALSATRLILMTSMGKPGDGGRMKKAGFSGYLSKPVQYGKLFKCLCAVIGSEAKKHSPLLITQHTISENEKKRIRILVAEDNTINQKVALRTLQKFGYRADAVANGQEAVNQLKEIPYDLVFMDIQMPEMDGLEAVRLIREASSGVQDPRVPVIAMTAGNRKDDRKRCLAAGMNDFICKPVEPDEMYALLRKYLHGGSQGERPGIE